MPSIVAIRFGDNDFYNTIMPWLRAIAENGLETYDFDKEKFVELFNRSASGFYWTCQNQLRYGVDDKDRIDNYLKITKEKVFFDEEVNEYLKQHAGWDNSEFFVIDASNRFAEPCVYCA